MEYNDIFTIDFIKRTQEIVKTYRSQYEHTLFLNACVGLLIIPEQALYTLLPQEEISEEKWCISADHVRRIKEKVKSVQIVARHIRNAIAHNGVKFESVDTNELSHIEFTDWTDHHHTTPTFNMRIEIERFEKFVWKISDFALQHQAELRNKK